jgi:hypothetical protein
VFEAGLALRLALALGGLRHVRVPELGLMLLLVPVGAVRTEVALGLAATAPLGAAAAAALVLSFGHISTHTIWPHGKKSPTKTRAQHYYCITW